MAKSLATLVLIALAALHAPAFGADTLARIKSAQAINIAYSADSLPFSFAEGDAREPKGYSIDLCKRIVAQIGRTVGVPNLKVNWIAGSTPERLRMVASGKADLECANTTQTLARMVEVDFSALIFLETGGFVARADAPARIADMGGKKIAVLKGTTTESRLRETLKDRLVNAEVVPIERAADGIAMLESGAADYYAGDRIKLVGLAAQAKDPSKLALLREQISYEPYALALPRNDSALRVEVNRALSQVYASGEIAPIYGQWLGPLGPPWDLLKAMYLLNSIPD